MTCGRWKSLLPIINMPGEKRTFGWIQNPSSTDSLKKIVSLFVPESDFYVEFVERRLPLIRDAHLLAQPDLYSKFQAALKEPRISYSLLKGKGAGNNGRKNAKCSGIAQAAIDGQQLRIYSINGHEVEMKKPYTDDWSADGFLRWAVSIGFMDYNYDDDTCSVTESGKKFVLASSPQEECSILGTAYLSYPPVCRILGLLCDGGHYTKFEIGRQLGFTDEAGFTSFPQNIWVQAYVLGDSAEKSTLRANTEGSSDKYARMICGWLSHIGWVQKSDKEVIEHVGGEEYSTSISSAYTITAEGLRNYKRAIGSSSSAKVPKIVYLEMLASKASNADELRTRRGHIIKYISGSTKRSIMQIVEYIESKGYEVNIATIKDDLQGLINIGLNIKEQGGLYQLKDEVLKLHIPARSLSPENKSEQTIIKERVRGRLNYIDHKYLTLIDYSFQGKDNQEFEIFTIDLFANELQFWGKHMGGTRKPDGLISYNKHGVIIDNKAYSHGFSITRHMADEMIRYVQENSDRREERNKNRWWDSFPIEDNFFNFLFISSLFKGNVAEALDGIKQATRVNGGAINTENLLYYADALKGGLLSKDVFLDKINQNEEIIYKQEDVLVDKLSQRVHDLEHQLADHHTGELHVHIDHVDTFNDNSNHISVNKAE